MKTLLYIMALALLVGCASSRSVAVSNGFVSVSLERTYCYGSCPDYIVTLLADGNVTFEGRHFVKKQGVFRKSIAPGNLTPIFKKIEAIHFWDLDNGYWVKRNPDGGSWLVTDLPTQYVTVKTHEKTKRVENYFGGPNGLSELENLIDEVAGVAEWIGSENEKKP